MLENCPDITAETAADSLPLLIRICAAIYDVDFGAAEEATTAEGVINAIAEEIALPIGNLIAVIVTYIALFIVSMVFTKIMLAIINRLVKKGVLGRVNKYFGLFAGGMFAMIAACIISNIAYKVSPDFAGGAISVFFRNINPFAILMKF